MRTYLGERLRVVHVNIRAMRGQQCERRLSVSDIAHFYISRFVIGERRRAEGGRLVRCMRIRSTPLSESAFVLFRRLVVSPLGGCARARPRRIHARHIHQRETLGVRRFWRLSLSGGAPSAAERTTESAASSASTQARAILTCPRMVSMAESRVGGGRLPLKSLL